MLLVRGLLQPVLALGDVLALPTSAATPLGLPPLEEGLETAKDHVALGITLKA